MNLLFYEFFKISKLKYDSKFDIIINLYINILIYFSLEDLEYLYYFKDLIYQKIINLLNILMIVFFYTL